jgi:intracellular multiplication protein IcmL
LDGLTTTIERKFFYRDGMRGALKVLLVSMVLNILLVAGLLYFASKKPPEPKYFATNNAGGLIELSSLDTPIVNLQGLNNWASKAVSSVYTYDFVNIDPQLENATNKYFSKEGKEAFLDQLSSSGAMDIVKNNKLVVSTTISGSPILENQGVLNGVYSWRLKIPATVTFQGAKEVENRKVSITLLISRASTLEKEFGLEIKQWNEVNDK